jgi:hypothetical protein
VDNHLRLAAFALTVSLLAAACGGNDDDGTTASAAGGDRLPQGSEPVDLDPERFSADVTNRYWPMEPGTRWTYREIDEGKTLDVVVIVSTETKKIANGVTARVVRDTVTEDGELIEDTFDWYAQDDAGNVWYLGEDTVEFEGGEISSREGAWEAGKDGAQPGIIMPADPADGMKYRQEYYEGEAEDNGEILSAEEKASVPAGDYEDVVLTKDTNALSPDALEYKLYAPGVGLVLALGIAGGGGREELVKADTVDDRVAEEAGTAPLGELEPE